MDPSAVAMSRTSPSGVLRVWLLGGFSVNLDGRTIDGSAWRGRKPRSLVKLLALSLPHPIDRERILDLLWPELSHEAAHNNLRQTVQTVRRVLRSSVSADSPALRPYGNGLLLWPPDEVWTDVDAFEIAAANASESRAPAAYRAALDLYVGDLLPEDEYEDWAVGRREALRSTRMALLLDLAALHEEAGSAGAAIDALLDVVAMDPLREDAHARLMRLYAESRKPHLARLQYHRLKAALQRELDAEPEPETEELYRRIVRGESGGSAPSMAALGSAGEHRSGRNNLPSNRTSFIGRREEIEAVSDLMAAGRMVTLTGPGGSGKTRLSIEVARAQLAALPDGVWFVDLSALGDGAGLPRAVAAAVGASELPARPVTETLMDTLKDLTALIVLDNCEQIAEACALFAAKLLAGCPGLRILATSRQSLNVPGEVTWRVASLSTPPPGSLPADMGSYDAVRLFVERARLAKPEFQLAPDNEAAVAEVCRRLDGIPLAIELAAANAGIYSPAEIVERLGDRFALLKGGGRGFQPRHRTLKAVIDWSYDRLDEEERQLFEGLSVFSGGATLDAAEQVCGTGPATVDILSRLVGKSLLNVERVRDGSARYTLLQTVREYALSRLDDRDRREMLEAAHADYFARLTADADRGIVGSSQRSWLAMLEREHDNIRGAIRWCLTSGSTTLGLRIVAAMDQFWWVRGYYREGMQWLSLCLRMASEQGDRGVAVEPAALAKALDAAGLMAECLGDWPQARDHYTRSIGIWRELGERTETGVVLTHLGRAALWSERFDEAKQFLEESLSVLDECGVVFRMAYPLLYLAMLANFSGDQRGTLALLERAEPLARETGDFRAAGGVLGLRGWVYLEMRDYPTARRYCRECVRTLYEGGDRWILALGLEVNAVLASALGEHARAVRIAGAGQALYEKAGGAVPPAFQTLFLHRIEESRQNLAPEAGEEEWAAGRAMALEEAVALVLDWDPLGAVPGGRPAVRGPAATGTPGELTGREAAVAALVAGGATNRRIAMELSISDGTVANHVERILRKLGLKSRSQVAACLAERGSRGRRP